MQSRRYQLAPLACSLRYTPPLIYITTLKRRWRDDGGGFLISKNVWAQFQAREHGSGKSLDVAEVAENGGIWEELLLDVMT